MGAEQLVLANVYAVVRDREDPKRILLQRRHKPKSDPANTGRWELPGGKWRAFESLVECARREISEETGLRDVEVPTARSRYDLLSDQVEVTDNVQLVQMIEGPYPSVLAVVDARASGTPLVEGDGSRDAQWIDESTIVAMLRDFPGSFTALSYAALMRRLGT